jgi:hypothetical protein
MQLIAAIFQVLNQVCFTIVTNVPMAISTCYPFTDIADFCYFSFQFLSSVVLIENITKRTPGYTQLITRYFLLGCFAISFGFLLYSAWVKERLILGGMCAALYHRQANQVGKIILFAINFILFIQFIIPTRKLFQKVKSSNKAKKKLNQAIIRVAFQLGIAMAGYLTTSALSFVGFWGNYFFVQFTLENYCGIVASTQDLGRIEKTSLTSTSKSVPNKISSHQPTTNNPK